MDLYVLTVPPKGSTAAVRYPRLTHLTVLGRVVGQPECPSLLVYHGPWELVSGLKCASTLHTLMITTPVTDVSLLLQFPHLRTLYVVTGTAADFHAYAVHTQAPLEYVYWGVEPWTVLCDEAVRLLWERCPRVAVQQTDGKYIVRQFVK